MNLNDKRLLALTQSGLWNTSLPIHLFENTRKIDWDIIFKSSSKQGVMGVAYDGLMHNIEELKIEKKILYAWAANVEAMELRYQKQYQTAKNLLEIYNHHQLHVLILKGIGLSIYYPSPSHREGGDIDIYLFDDFEKGNQIIEQKGIKVLRGDSVNPKHTVFNFQHTLIENHEWFLTDNPYLRKNKYLETQLKKHIHLTFCEQSNIGNQVVYYPSPTFNAYYLAAHMSSHLLTSNVSLRHLCDWALFVDKHYHQIDFEEVTYHFKKTDLYKAYQVLTSLTNRYLMPHNFKPIPVEKISEKIENIVWNKKTLQPSEKLISQNNYKKYAKKWREFLKNLFVLKKLTNTMFVFRFLVSITYKHVSRKRKHV